MGIYGQVHPKNPKVEHNKYHGSTRTWTRCTQFPSNQVEREPFKTRLTPQRKNASELNLHDVVKLAIFNTTSIVGIVDISYQMMLTGLVHQGSYIAILWTNKNPSLRFSDAVLQNCSEDCNQKITSRLFKKKTRLIQRKPTWAQDTALCESHVITTRQNLDPLLKV